MKACRGVVSDVEGREVMSYREGKLLDSSDRGVLHDEQHRKVEIDPECAIRSLTQNYQGKPTVKHFPFSWQS